MLFTKASEYALVAMICIAKKNGSCDVDTLANELGIPKSFLAKILQNLAKAKLLNSFKGAKGGFTLVKTPDKITLNEIITGAEKRQTAVFECSIEGSICPSGKGDICQIRCIFETLQEKVDGFLNTITLEDIIKSKV
ncbi:MAG: Rrf2 family transcriptional regulator [Campylobacter sp.]|nr:Rrf2 family transcriptional regulator [Campylobacter sp.]MBQ7271728.1 Rrf2 family transcriptional regulator [Campylobacter sp.]MBQ9291968.1 Rrf2 family transcriptional regulator [Campylobacter sp.]MBQ9876587.1 Rrf2 family transcriptional regulator [Campylobacter sp.]MBR0071909.1 Rrf2 family transcriptional regulator [Campylobacter sp.]